MEKSFLTIIPNSTKQHKNMCYVPPYNYYRKKCHIIYLKKCSYNIFVILAINRYFAHIFSQRF